MVLKLTPAWAGIPGHTGYPPLGGQKGLETRVKQPKNTTSPPLFRATVIMVPLIRVQGKARGRARKPRDPRIARGAAQALLSPLGFLALPWPFPGS